MFNVSFGEILFFGIIALIILGPEKFPQALRSALLKYRHFKTLMNKVQQDIEQELELIELKKFMQEELERIKKSEDELKATLQEMQNKIDEHHHAMIRPRSSPIQSHPFYHHMKQSMKAPFQSNFYSRFIVSHAYA